jgi:hypothetical protein
MPDYRLFQADIVDVVKMVNARFLSEGLVDPLTFGPAVTTSLRTVEEAIKNSRTLENRLRTQYTRFNPITGYLYADEAFERLWTDTFSPATPPPTPT